MEIVYKPKAIADRNYHKRSGNKKLMTKIQNLIFELEDHPETGTGKPEQLKYELSGFWSRRINSEHRLVYTISYSENTVTIYSMKDHY